MDNKIETIIYVKGPDIAVDHEPFIVTCREMGIKTFVIGDGIRDIQLTEITDIIKEQKGEVFLFFDCHGIRPLSETAQKKFNELEAELEQKNSLIDEEIKHFNLGILACDNLISKTTGAERERLQATRSEFADKIAELTNIKNKNNDIFLYFEGNETNFKDELHLIFNETTHENQTHPLTLRTIFTAVSKHTPEANIHYWFSTCFAGYGHKIVKDYLKPNDTFIAFGEPTKTIYQDDTKHYLSSFPKDRKIFYPNDLTISSIFTDFCLTDAYCSSEADDNQAMPRISFADKTFDASLLTYPRQYSQDHLDIIAQKLGAYCKKEVLDSVVTKLQKISSLQELSREEQRVAIAAEYSLFKK